MGALVIALTDRVTVANAGIEGKMPAIEPPKLVAQGAAHAVATTSVADTQIVEAKYTMPD